MVEVATTVKVEVPKAVKGPGETTEGGATPGVRVATKIVHRTAEDTGATTGDALGMLAHGEASGTDAELRRLHTRERDINMILGGAKAMEEARRQSESTRSPLELPSLVENAEEDMTPEDRQRNRDMFQLGVQLARLGVTVDLDPTSERHDENVVNLISLALSIPNENLAEILNTITVIESTGDPVVIVRQRLEQIINQQNETDQVSSTLNFFKNLLDLLLKILKVASVVAPLAV